MGKLVTWISVVLLVLVVPLGSWYYLKTGLDFRKKALSELTPKETLDMSLDSTIVFLRKTSLISLRNNKDTQKDLDKIYDQFKNSYTFQIISLDTGAYYLPISSTMKDKLFSIADSSSFLLMDTSYQIRSVYGNSMDDTRKLIEHLAIIMPKLKDADIKMKK